MEIIDTELTTREIADRLAGKMQHTGPVTLVIAPDRTTEREKRSRSYGNAYSRYKHLDIASSGDFPDIETARAAAVDVLTSRGAAAEDIEAVRAIEFGRGITAAGLYLLIRETD